MDGRLEAERNRKVMNVYRSMGNGQWVKGGGEGFCKYRCSMELPIVKSIERAEKNNRTTQINVHKTRESEEKECGRYTIPM